MSRVAGRTLHSALRIQGKYFRYLHGGRWRDVYLVLPDVVHFCPRVRNASVMTGLAHFRRRDDLLRSILNQVGSLPFDKKSIDPAIVAYGATLCRIRVFWGFDLCKRCVGPKGKNDRQEQFAPVP